MVENPPAKAGYRGSPPGPAVSKAGGRGSPPGPAGSCMVPGNSARARDY